MAKKKKKNDGTIELVIYGIFHESTQKVLKVSLSKEEMELELGLGDYDDDDCIVEMPVTLFLIEPNE